MKNSELRVFDDVVQAIGKTPLVKLNKVTRGFRAQVWEMMVGMK